MELATRDGGLIVRDGKLAGKCECCTCGPCCWSVTEHSGCPGPKVTISDAGRTILLCFQDSGNCGDIACDRDQEQTGGCAGSAPCSNIQTIAMKTSFTIKEPVTLTVSIQGRVEVVDPGFDTTTVTLSGIGSVTIGSSMGVTGGGDCSMNFVDKSESFEVPAGCLDVAIFASTVDALWHYGMYSRITLTFSDDTKVAACAGKLCTTYECVVVESGMSSPEKIPFKPLDPDEDCLDGPGTVDLEAGVNPCIGSTRSCVPVKNSASQQGVDLNDCVIECSQGECQNVRFYCCNEIQDEGDQENPEDTGGIVNLAPIRRECKKKTWRVCSTEDNGTTDSQVPPGAFRTLSECRENCQPEGYECLDNVCTPTDDPDAPYATLAECEEECLGRFVCDDMGECIQTADPNAPHENRDACEEECDQRFVCAPNGGCYQSADGPYATLAECEQNCDPPPDGIYCVLVNNETLCKPGPIPEGETILSGPHNGYLSCYEVCRKHACVVGCGGVQKCTPSNEGAYKSLSQCLEGCADPAAAPCTLEETTGVGPGVFPFQIDAAERKVCISYVSIGGQAIRLRAQYKRINQTTCKPDGIWGPTSDWRGYEECDCRDLRPGGPLKGGPKGYISFRKPKGITQFFLIVQAPCPDTDVEWTVRCTGAPCSEPEEPDPIGACCILGVCQDGVKKSQCDSFNGKWLGPCTECEPGDCVDPRGACCLPDGTCLERTEAECDTIGGVYHGDGVPCLKVTCPPPPLRGACCFGDGCTEGVTQEECEFWGGEYLGNDSTCGPPDPCRGCCCEGDECYEGVYEKDCPIQDCTLYIAGPEYSNTPIGLVPQSVQTITVPEQYTLPVTVTFNGACDDGLVVNGQRVSFFAQTPAPFEINARTFQVGVWNDGGPWACGGDFCFSNKTHEWFRGGLCCPDGPWPTYAESITHPAYYIHLTTDCPESWLNGVTIPLTYKFENSCAFSCNQYFQGWLGSPDSCDGAWVAMRAGGAWVDYFSLYAQLRTYESRNFNYTQGSDLEIICHWRRRGIVNSNTLAGSGMLVASFVDNNVNDRLCFDVSKTKFQVTGWNYHAGLHDYALSGCSPSGNFVCGDSTTPGCKTHYGPEAANNGVTIEPGDLCDSQYRVYVEISPLP